MAGLGFANPELQKARMLASLNGSTAIPQNVPAVGQAPQAAPSAMPQMPNPQASIAPQQAQMPQGGPQPIPMPQIDPREQIARMGQQPQQGAPQDPEGRDPKWYEVAGALGHIVLSIDAGLRNQPMPDPPGGDPRQQQDQAMQVQEFLFNTSARAWEAIRNAPPESRGAMLKQFQEIIAKVDPSFDLPSFIEGMMDDSDWADQVAPQLAVMSEEGKSMFMARVRARGGDPATAAGEVIKDREFMDSLQAFEDQRNVPILKFKMQKVRAAMVSMNMDPDTFAGMSPEDFKRVNDLLPESVRLTPSELATLQRQPELGEPIGWSQPTGRDAPTPQAGGAPTMDDRAGYSPPPRRPRPAAAVAPTEAPARDATGRPPTPRGASAPSQTPQRPQTRQPQQPAPGSPRSPAPAPSSTGRPAAAPKPTKPAQAPYYPPGWNPRTPKPRPEPVPVTQVDAVGKRPQKPAQQPAPPPKAASGMAPGERRVKASKDTTVPGLGKVKAGEIIIYNDETGEYRRG